MDFVVTPKDMREFKSASAELIRLVRIMTRAMLKNNLVNFDKYFFMYEDRMYSFTLVNPNTYQLIRFDTPSKYNVNAHSKYNVFLKLSPGKSIDVLVARVECVPKKVIEAHDEVVIDNYYEGRF